MTRNRIARGGVLVLSAALAAASVGCDARPAPECGTTGGASCTQVVTWDFETDCAGDLCGYEVTAGSARRVAPFGPGEHVMELGPGALVQAGVSLATPSVQEAVGLLVRCDAGTSLRVAETAFAWTAEGGTGQSLHAVSDEQVLHPGTEWEVMNTRFAPRAASDFSQRVVLRLGTSGAGTCSVDEIAFGALDSNRVQR